MDEISAVAMFCSDIREEKGGTATIVGVMPDTLRITQMPGALPKLCVYVRMHINVSFDPGTLFSRVVFKGKELSKSDVQGDLFEKTRDKARASGKGYVGLISTFVMAPFAVAEEGRIDVLVTANGIEHLVGSLDVQLAQSKST